MGASNLSLDGPLFAPCKASWTSAFGRSHFLAGRLQEAFQKCTKQIDRCRYSKCKCKCEQRDELSAISIDVRPLASTESPCHAREDGRSCLLLTVLPRSCLKELRERRRAKVKSARRALGAGSIVQPLRSIAPRLSLAQTPWSTSVNANLVDLGESWAAPLKCLLAKGASSDLIELEVGRPRKTGDEVGDGWADDVGVEHCDCNRSRWRLAGSEKKSGGRLPSASASAPNSSVLGEGVWTRACCEEAMLSRVGLVTSGWTDEGDVE